MSKCDIEIAFDRPDRTYRGGDRVTGRVRIVMREAVTTTGIELRHHWETHGRGNVAKGQVERLASIPGGVHVAGDVVEAVFAFRAPSLPLTYHGHLVNLDHYVFVEVHVPWAFDPKARLDYTLRAGQPPEHLAARRREPVSLSPTAARPGGLPVLSLGALAIICLALIMGPLVFLATCLVFGTVFGVRSWRRWSLSRSLGDVVLTIPHAVVHPAEPWTVRLRFTPRRHLRIDGVSLRLTAEEAATSGSGTDKTTHRHTLLDRVESLLPSGDLPRDVPVTAECSFTFPNLEAWSLDVDENKVTWNATVRVHIPWSPDWVQVVPLQFVPVEFVAPLADVPAAAARPPGVTGGGPAAAGEAEPPPVPGGGTFPRAEPRMPDRGELAAILAAIHAAPRYGGERAAIVRGTEGRSFRGTVVVDGVSSTMGQKSGDSRYDYGRTVTGLIAGSEQPIEVLTREASNESVDGLRRGDEWTCQLTLRGWDDLYGRLQARQIDTPD